MTFQRLLQGISLATFVVLVGLTAFPLITPITVDAFISMDPVVVAGTWLSGRNFIPAFWAGVLILVATPLVGRFFCSTLCPMGTTLDLADRCFGATGQKTRHTPGLRPIKFFLLFFILGAALLGVSFVFLASPLSLITRFYGLILYPALSAAAAKIFSFMGPLAETLNLPAVSYVHIAVPRFSLQWVTVVLFIGIFAGALSSPRFWCRYLCPAGAAFALLAKTPRVRRRVSNACTTCGICQKKCPMDAIGENPADTHHDECIVCETCVRACPVKAITFAPTAGRRHLPATGFINTRRRFLGATLAGAGAAVVTHTSLSYPLARNGLGVVAPPDLIRPPGAVPEIDFLATCIRCGACMKACPTNTLQPIGLAAGVAAFFSPRVIARRGPCEPSCNACGRVCPTGALRSLSGEEKIWAKIGTAQILRHRCLAWEFDKKCLVCDEVCPFGAVTLQRVPGISSAVPFVDETRCSGCGFCEFHCPVQHQSAIEITPMSALRITTGSYRETGRRQGLALELKRHRQTDSAPEAQFNSLPPGFTP